MKFKIKSNIKPLHGGFRTRKKFLLLPMKIKDEIRWLEKATIVEKYCVYQITQYPIFWGSPIHYEEGRWEKVAFDHGHH